MKTKQLLIGAIALMMALPMSAVQTTWYVRSDSGNDTSGDGSLAKPWKTFTTAYGKAAVLSGDILDVSGTFTTDYGRSFSKSITIQGNNKATAIFDGTDGNATFKNFANMTTASVTIVIENVTFQNYSNYSTSSTKQGGVLSIGAAATGTDCNVTFRNVIFKNNSSTLGGAIQVAYNNNLTLEDCYFVGNSAKDYTTTATTSGSGGVLYISTAANASNISINRCLFEGNKSYGGSGAAILYQSSAVSGTASASLTITNSTFSGNTLMYNSATAPAVSDGILNLNPTGSGVDVKLINNTIAYNSSARTSSGATPGLYVRGLTNITTLINNILFSNFDTQAVPVSTSIGNATSILNKESRNNITDVPSGTYNWTTKTTNGATMASGNVSSIVNGSSIGQLGLAANASALADNGGATKTLAITSTNSAAKDAGYTTGAPTIDQRGITRNTVDKGAYEYVTYRSKAPGNWGSTTSWESTGDNTTWADVTVIPTVNVAGTITIQNTHEITVAANATSPALTINSGGKLTLYSSYTLAVTGNLNIQSDGSNGTGTFVDKSTNGLTVSGTSTVNQNLSSPLRSWYMSSPVTSAQPTGMDRIKYYNEAANSWPTLYNSSVSTPVPYGENSFTTGKGYLVVPLSGNSISFTGALNAGEKSITLLKTDGAAKTGFNLIGNPYPSYLDWKAVYDYTTGSEVYPNRTVLVDGTMWYRTKVEVTPATDPVTYEYKFWTVNGLGVGSVSEATKYIAPMQAFWVRAKTIGSELLTLNNDMLSHGEATNKLLKAPKAKNSVNPLVRLQVSNGANTDEAVIYFSANASNERDVYDAPKMSNENAAIPEIYTTQGTEQLVINGMNTIPMDQEIGLGFVAGDATSFSIKANEVRNLPADVKLILKDNVTNVETEVTDGVTAYAFTPLATSGTRFSVIFRSAGAVTGFNSQDDNMLLAYSTQKNQITLVNNNVTNVGSTASVYNAVGQKLMSKQLSGSITLLDGNFNPGVYVVKVNNISKKVIVK